MRIFKFWAAAPFCKMYHSPLAAYEEMFQI